jgi:hypothetical protein
MEKFYETPEIELVKVNVEKGFAGTPSGELNPDEETEE